MPGQHDLREATNNGKRAPRTASNRRSMRENNGSGKTAERSRPFDGTLTLRGQPLRLRGRQARRIPLCSTHHGSIVDTAMDQLFRGRKPKRLLSVELPARTPSINGVPEKRAIGDGQEMPSLRQLYSKRSRRLTH